MTPRRETMSYCIILSPSGKITPSTFVSSICHCSFLVVRLRANTRQAFNVDAMFDKWGLTWLLDLVLWFGYQSASNPVIPHQKSRTIFQHVTSFVLMYLSCICCETFCDVSRFPHPVCNVHSLGRRQRLCNWQCAAGTAAHCHPNQRPRIAVSGPAFGNMFWAVWWPYPLEMVMGCQVVNNFIYIIYIILHIYIIIHGNLVIYHGNIYYHGMVMNNI